MIFDLTIVRGKPINGKALTNYINKLDGNYTVNIEEENTLTTPKECRGAYFFKVDMVSRHTGDERYVIHERFKEAYGITSTKNFSVTDWRNLIKKFQIYTFETLDIVI